MLEKDPKKRIKIIDAMEHSWFMNAHKCPYIEDEVQDTIMQRLTSFHGRNKLKKAAIQLLVKQMSESSFSELRSIFNEMDTDKSGTINKDELKRALSLSKSTVDIQEN